MAISGSFKQQCPSCEANVPIKDGSLIGKKVDCPKCKYRFLVEDPAAKDKKKVAGAGDAAAVKKKETAVPSKKKAPPVEEEILDADAEEEVDEPETRKPKKKKKKAAAGSNKMLIGLALGGVGLIILAVAAFFMLGSGGDAPKKVAKGGKAAAGAAKGKGDEDPNDPSGADPKLDGKAAGPDERVVPVGGLAGFENTNFLPTNTEGVYHCNFKDFLDSPLGKTAFATPGAFSDAEFKQKLGIAASAVDDIVTAESYSENWIFHVIHTTSVVKDMRPLIQAMGLKEWTGNATKHKCYELQPSSAAWVLALTKLPLFVPAHMLSALPASAKERPLLLHMRNAQTLIFAHAEPMLAYLQAGGNIEPNRANTTSSKKFDSSGDPFRPEPYLSINPSLRDMLHRVAAGKEGKVLFSSATEMRQAALRGKNLDSAGRLVFRVRPFWDVVNLLDEKTNRIEYVGLALLMKDPSHYVFNNSLVCNTTAETQHLHDELLDNVGWRIAQFFDKVMAHKVEVFYDDVATAPPVPPPGPPGLPPGFGQPTDPKPQPPKKVEPTYSHVAATVGDKVVDFSLHLALSGEALNHLRGAVQLMAIGLKADADSAAGKDYRFQLGDAGKTLGEKGLSKRSVPPETFPPAAFPRQPSEMWNAREPAQRISWMAGLLPYLGHDTLFSRIDFDKSWRDGPNWLAARSLVPQFLDPAFPASSHYVAYPGMPLGAAATHYVGIAGVGIDAADAKPGDAALVGKLGIFGYNRMTPLSTINDKGRGLANTVLLIRVPHDGPAGVTPWIAGGGSTVRSVPDKNSLAPFLSVDAKGEGGTTVLMADGSVRFLKKGMSDAAFKAICTVDGPTPGDLKLDEDYPKLEPTKEEVRALANNPVPVGPGTGKGGASGAAQTLPKGWKQVTHKAGGFTIALPSEAAAFGEPMTKDGFSGTYYGYKVENAANKMEFFAGSVKPTQAPDKSNEDQIFAQAKQGLVQSGGTLVTNEKPAYGTNAGREYAILLQLPTGQEPGFARCYIVQDRVFILVMGGPGVKSGSPEYRAFFDSFRLANAK